MNSNSLDMTSDFTISRRRVLIGGVALIGTSLFGSAFAQEQYKGVMAKPGGSKPTYLPETGSKDPVAHSVAENLFWNEQMMEHAAFFVMLMPGPELAKQRAEAEAFKSTFASQLAKSGTVTEGNYRAFNQSTIDEVQRLVDFKHRMREEQAAGRLKSLVWPTFFDHTAREGEYFVARLKRLSVGDVSLDRAKTAEFWTLIMGEHAGFIAHLLDPTERELVQKAMKTNDAFLKLHAQNPAPKDKTIKAVDDIIDFKVAAEKGIETGKIKSIIDPALADHVRREALKAADELRRAA
jgi:hypothetical protein